LSWIADRPSVIAPIVGARTVEHLRNNLGAAELTLNDETTAALEKVSAPAIPMEPLAKASARAGCRMGRQPRSNPLQGGPTIRSVRRPSTHDIGRNQSATCREQASCLGRGLCDVLCVFVLIASEFMPVSLLSPIAHDLHLTTGQAISISGIFAFLATCVAFAPSYAILMIGRAFLGIAIGGFWSMSAGITESTSATMLNKDALAVIQSNL
jgi:hypothetical protein